MPNIVVLTLKEKKSALACTTEQGVCLCIADDVQAAVLGAWRAVYWRSLLWYWLLSLMEQCTCVVLVFDNLNEKLVNNLCFC